MMMAKTGQAVYMQKQETSLHLHLSVKVIIAVLFFLAATSAMSHLFSNPDILPVNKVRFHGSFKNVNEKMLHGAIDGVISGGYFNINVENVRHAIEKMPWVKQASVRRVWPNTLSVKVIEQQAVAKLVSGGLVNNLGGIFSPGLKTYPDNIPVFDGPHNLSKAMLEHYQVLKHAMLGIKKQVLYMKFDARHSMSVKIDNGIVIRFGRNNIQEKLGRLISIYADYLEKKEQYIESIDLRYTNGMAVRWKNDMYRNKGI